MPSPSAELAPFTDLGGVGGPVRVDPEAAAPLAVRRAPFAVAPTIVLVCASAPKAPLLEETPDLLRAGAGPPNLHLEHAARKACGKHHSV